MQTKGRIFDDLARVANGAAGTLSGVRHEIEGMVKQRLERVLADMDLVGRDEFEAVKEVAAKARLEQEALEKRVVALEKALEKAGGAKKTAAKKTAPKKAGAKKAGVKKAGVKKAGVKKAGAKTAAKRPAKTAAKRPAKKAQTGETQTGEAQSGETSGG